MKVLWLVLDETMIIFLTIKGESPRRYDHGCEFVGTVVRVLCK